MINVNCNESSVIVSKRSRGVVRDYTPRIELRLVNALTCFLGDEPTGREVFITLTTKMSEPKRTKQSFRKWIGTMCYEFDCCGIYVVEFNLGGLVHYHVVLRFKGPSLTPEGLAAVVKGSFDRWACYGDRNRQAFDAEKVYDTEKLVCYMAKLPYEDGRPHVERWQKFLPPALQDCGLGANWWGYVNRKGVRDCQWSLVNRERLRATAMAA